jgi:hypothetical protein
VSEINGEEAWAGSRLAPARRALRGEVRRDVPGNAPKNASGLAASSPVPGREAQPAAQEAVLPTGAAALESLESHEPMRDLWLVLAYFVVAFTAQLLLLIPQLVTLRVPLRIAPFGISLLLMVLPVGQRGTGHRIHPAMPMAVIIFCIISFGLLNQMTDSTMGGLAQIALTVAILSPLIWVGRLHLGVRGFATILLCLWGFNALSAAVGVLQIEFPGHFQGATSMVTQQNEENNNISYEIELADGTQTERPYGLTDQPGGAATAGLTAFVFGLGLLVSSKNMVMRGVYLASMGLGLFIMYLSQVRVSLVMCLFAVVAFSIIMAMRGEFARLTGSLMALGVVAVVATSAAFIIGGSQTRDRFFTLVDDSAGNVYQNNRGFFLDYTFEYVLPTYPFGAGLGRYGMMSHYFGKGEYDPNALWAEIQWTAWAYDGGWPMVVAYPIALLVALWVAFSIGINVKYGAVGLWAAILTAYGCSVLAVTFDYPFFNSQNGLEFWLLNAALWSVAQTELFKKNQDVPEGFESLPAPWKPQVGGAVAGADAVGGGSAWHAAPRRRPLANRPRPAVIPIFDQSDASEGTV